jgi:hypothetical protein
MQDTVKTQEQLLLEQIRQEPTVKGKLALYQRLDQLRLGDRDQRRLEAQQQQKTIEELVTEIQNSRPKITLPVK